MTHLHVPDGVLPLWLWLAGWVLTVAALWLAERRVGQRERARRVPLLGVVAALVLVSMSIEIVPIAYHVNLTVVAGVMLGPWLGLVAAFVVSVVLALMGHGGVTVIGLNAILLGAEIILGWALFRGFLAALRARRIRLAAGAATAATLALTTTMLVGIVALAGTTWTSQPTGVLDPTTLSIEAPRELFSVGEADDAHGEADDAHDEVDAHGGDTGEHDEGAAHAHEDTSDEPTDEAGHEHGPALSVGRFATVVFVLGPVGWLIEALLTAAIVGYVARVRPDLVFPGFPPAATPLPGDSQGLR